MELPKICTVSLEPTEYLIIMNMSLITLTFHMDVSRCFGCITTSMTQKMSKTDELSHDSDFGTQYQKSTN